MVGSVQSGRRDSNPRSRVPKTRGLAAVLRPGVTVRTAGFEPAISWPPTRRDTRLRYVLLPLHTQKTLHRHESTPQGSRTPIGGSKVRCPRPLDERGISARTVSASGPGGARILVSWSSAKRYTVSATGPCCFGDCTKKPDVVVTPGQRFSRGVAAKCHKRGGCPSSIFAE